MTKGINHNFFLQGTIVVEIYLTPYSTGWVNFIRDFKSNFE